MNRPDYITIVPNYLRRDLQGGLNSVPPKTDGYNDYGELPIITPSRTHRSESASHQTTTLPSSTLRPKGRDTKPSRLTRWLSGYHSPRRQPSTSNRLSNVSGRHSNLPQTTDLARLSTSPTSAHDWLKCEESTLTSSDSDQGTRLHDGQDQHDAVRHPPRRHNNRQVSFASKSKSKSIGAKGSAFQPSATNNSSISMPAGRRGHGIERRNGRLHEVRSREP